MDNKTLWKIYMSFLHEFFRAQILLPVYRCHFFRWFSILASMTNCFLKEKTTRKLRVHSDRYVL